VVTTGAKKYREDGAAGFSQREKAGGATSLKPGARLDKYEILEEIGRGGMGTVYKALHPHFKKYVAIKEIRSELAGDPEIERRFEREAELLAQLPPHPNIVTVRDAMALDGRLYLVMDYIEGESLAEVVSRGGVNPEQGAALLDQILSGLEAIHKRGIVHHDLKSSNILLDREGTAYITDFGIAECRRLKHFDSQQTVMATARYAAPELIDPSLGREATEYQIDVYAAGMLAYEMLLGEERFRERFPRVYKGPPEGVAERWLEWHTDISRAAPNLNDVDERIPRSLANVIERMMAKNMNERYRDAGEARRDIESGRTGGQSEESTTVPLDKIRQGARAGRPAQVQPEIEYRRPERIEPSVRIKESPVVEVKQTAPPTLKNSRFPMWLLSVGGALFITVAGIIFLIVMTEEPGFTLLVRGAPPGSDIYIDNVRRGVMTEDGSIRVSTLKAGKRLVRVGHEGYVDFNSTVSGADGEIRTLLAQMSQSEVKQGLPREIDYTGQMILIPAGEFIMGDDNSLPNEKPAHKVPLPDYYIDKYEVTNAQYKRFCEATGRKLPTNPWWDEKYVANNPDSPVVGVSWNDAFAYCQWAGKRLPTEAEWEKASSWQPENKKKRIWPWGDSADTSLANINSSHPTPMSQFPSGASNYGVIDMAGNAAEWVDSYYQPYQGNQIPDQDYGTQNKVVRGGSFRSTPEDAKTTRRLYHAPEFRADEKRDRSWLIGFRCVVSADDSRLKEHLRAKGIAIK
jgi:formylglycine-generating enzyme required for sulfatase activity/serine/threonine protein kinase